MPLSTRAKVILAKIESVYGTDPTPDGSSNAILAVEARITPMEGQDKGRNLDLAYFGNQGTVPVDLHSKMTFKVELAPSGTAGTAPGWGVLLRMCGCAQTVDPGVSVIYNPITASIESGTIYFYIAGVRYILKGARGNVVFRVSASDIPYMEFEFTGLFSVATDQSLPTPTLTAFKNPQVASTIFTPTFEVDATAMVLRTFALNAGNQVEGRFLIGSEGILITGRSPTIEATVEATPLSTFDPYTAALGLDPVTVELVHGVGAGKIATLDVPVAQLQRPAGLESQQDIAEWPLRLNALPDSGNDDWTLTLT